jgi:hypothetical protein
VLTIPGSFFVVIRKPTILVIDPVALDKSRTEADKAIQIDAFVWAHEDRRVEMFAEQRDRQVTVGWSDHHPGNDSVTRICGNVGALSPPISGGRGDMSVHPVRKRLGRLPLDRLTIERVPRGSAFYRVQIGADLKISEIALHAFWPFRSLQFAGAVMRESLTHGNFKVCSRRRSILGYKLVHAKQPPCRGGAVNSFCEPVGSRVGLETVSGVFFGRIGVMRSPAVLERAAPRSFQSEPVVDVAVLLPGLLEHLPSDALE